MISFKFAIIGTGRISKTHIEAINSLSNVEIVGVLSMNNHQRSEKIAKRLSIKAYKNFPEVLRDKSVDAVSIVTKNDLHAKLGIMAANSKKHVIVEKPIATNSKDAEKLTKACFVNEVKLATIFQNRFSQLWIKAREDIQKGKFGSINLIVFSWFLSKDSDYFTNSPWRKYKKSAGGGFLMMNAIHYIDLLQWFFGPVDSVCGDVRKVKHKNIEVEDTAWATIKFKKGFQAIIYGSTAGYRNIPPTLEIYGSKKNEIIQDSKYLIADKDIFAKQISNFIDSVKKNGKPLVCGMEAKKSLAIVMSIYKAVKLRRWIKVIY